MTEKRFELIELYGDDHLIDNETNEKVGYDLHSPSTFNANWNNVCNLLNALHEENEWLKRENKTLAGGLTAYFESKIKRGDME